VSTENEEVGALAPSDAQHLFGGDPLGQDSRGLDPFRRTRESRAVRWRLVSRCAWARSWSELEGGRPSDTKGEGGVITCRRITHARQRRASATACRNAGKALEEKSVAWMIRRYGTMSLS